MVFLKMRILKILEIINFNNMMKFEFTVHPHFNFVESFAKHFGLPVARNRVTFPQKKGEGFIKLIEINQDMKCVIHHYHLKEDFFLKRLSSDNENEMLSLVDRKSTRLNSSHVSISYAVFCLKKKK